MQVQNLNRTMLEAKGFTVKLAMSIKEAEETIILPLERTQ